MALTALKYVAGWLRYDAGLRPPFGHVSGAAAGRDRTSILHYYLSANVIKASEDKTYPGAIVASLASPWGQSVPAGNRSGERAVYFGSYREVFARDLYEAFTGLLVDGDLATARAATRFLFDQQQLADGSMPRNSLLNGKPAPDTGGTQLDETSYPIIMALQAGLRQRRRCGATTSGPPPTSWSRTGRRSAWSGGRSRPGTPRPPSPPRSPG